MYMSMSMINAMASLYLLADGHSVGHESISASALSTYMNRQESAFMELVLLVHFIFGHSFIYCGQIGGRILETFCPFLACNQMNTESGVNQLH